MYKLQIHISNLVKLNLQLLKSIFERTFALDETGGGEYGKNDLSDLPPLLNIKPRQLHLISN